MSQYKDRNGVLMFFCEPYNCWLMPGRCVTRRKDGIPPEGNSWRTSKNKKPHFCLSCQVYERNEDGVEDLHERKGPK